MVYRILSLDGGGTWSLFQAAALRKLYDPNTRGHTVLADFDLAAANSGGSLVLGGLIENLTLDELFDYFQDEQKRKAIFSPNSSLLNWILQKLIHVGPKHSTELKLPAIQAILPKTGRLQLEHAAAEIPREGRKIHLLIIGFDYDRSRAAFFRSAQAGKPRAAQRAGVQQASWGSGESSKITLADAIHASTNAPVNYFDFPAAFPKHPQRYWDGGVTGCNNPVLAAVTEALVLGQEPADIVALSIGTGTVALPWPKEGEAPSPFVQARTKQSLLADVRKLATSILDDPPDIASFLAHVMTGGGKGVVAPADSHIVRMSPMISPIKVDGKWGAPGNWKESEFADLKELDIDAVEPDQIEQLTKYAELWIGNSARNQPMRMKGDELKLELGYEWFKDAEDAWRTISGIKRK
jgi:uncharacterized protein